MVCEEPPGNNPDRNDQKYERDVRAAHPSLQREPRGQAAGDQDDGQDPGECDATFAGARELVSAVILAVRARRGGSLPGEQRQGAHAQINRKKRTVETALGRLRATKSKIGKPGQISAPPLSRRSSGDEEKRQVGAHPPCLEGKRERREAVAQGNERERDKRQPRPRGISEGGDERYDKEH